MTEIIKLEKEEDLCFLLVYNCSAFYHNSLAQKQHLVLICAFLRIHRIHLILTSQMPAPHNWHPISPHPYKS